MREQQFLVTASARKGEINTMTVSHSPEQGSAPQNPAHQHRTQNVTAARARAQRAKLNTQTRTRAQQSGRKKAQQDVRRRIHTSTSIADAIDAYLQDHKGGNHSPKTLEWHATALGLLRRYLEEERAITWVENVDAAAISAWFAYLRSVPGQRGKPRCERTVQTYARSARAFFRWLMRREMLARNPFDQVAFPKVGRPLIQTIEPEEFEQLLQACAPQGESGWLVERAVGGGRPP
jgi:integrase